MKDHSFNMEGGGGELWVGMRKKPAFKRGPEKKMKENGVGWLLNKNTCTYEIDLKFF